MTMKKKFMQLLKKPTITKTIRLHRLHSCGHVQRMEENSVPKRVLYMNLESTRPRVSPKKFMGR
jgi:DNA-binding HxlR family transcriptional regulator